MNRNKQDLFSKEYFEEGKGLEKKRVYNWESTRLYFEVIANSINSTFKPQRILDIGCAKGYLVYLFNEQGIDAYGVDISSYAISKAPEEIKDKLYTLDIEEENLPFPDNLFDLITIVEVLEHLNSFEHLIKEIKRILKKNGYILITTPTPKGRYAKADETHINVQSRRFWVELFNKDNLILVNNIWHSFKATFLKEFKKIMPENPPSTKISAVLMKMGKIGNAIRNNIVPYIEYSSPFRSNEILLFKKVE